MFQDPFILSALAVLAAVSGIYLGVPRLRCSGRAADTGMKVAAPGCFVSLLVFSGVMTAAASFEAGMFLVVTVPLILVPAAFIVLPNLTDMMQTRLGQRVTPGQKLAAMICYFGFLILFLAVFGVLAFLYKVRNS